MNAHTWQLLDASAVRLPATAANFSPMRLHSIELPIIYLAAAHAFMAVAILAIQCIPDGSSAPHSISLVGMLPMALPAMMQLLLQLPITSSSAVGLQEVCYPF